MGFVETQEMLIVYGRVELVQKTITNIPYRCLKAKHLKNQSDSTESKLGLLQTYFNRRKEVLTLEKKITFKTCYIQSRFNTAMLH